MALATLQIGTLFLSPPIIVVTPHCWLTLAAANGSQRFDAHLNNENKPPVDQLSKKHFAASWRKFKSTGR